jgi:hypothetical protein
MRRPSRRGGPSAEPEAVNGELSVASEDLEADSHEASTEDASESGGRDGHGREDKIGVLMTRKSEVSQTDPVPDIPQHCVDPLRILTRAREIKGSVTVGERASVESEEEEPAVNPRGSDPPSQPRPILRSTVATRRPVQPFGEILAQAAWARGFMGAARQAFVADGASANWRIHKRWFSDFTAILDFIHALTSIFASAMAGRSSGQGWAVSTDWIQRVWSGRVDEVIEALTVRQSELGDPEEGDKETSPRCVVADPLSSLRNNQGRMR